jgi:hypothetical protein
MEVGIEQRSSRAASDGTVSIVLAVLDAVTTR